ncbi:MAG: hypothetical protein V9E86_10470 [Nitrosomonas sp.]
MVIGGGNVAMDIARTLARHAEAAVSAEVDVVALTALEDQQHFLADPDEIKEARRRRRGDSRRARPATGRRDR